MTLPDAPEMEISSRRSPWRNLSLVWLVPVLALVVTLGIAWQNYAGRGTLVTINFPTAAGVLPGETTVRFREVVIGLVEDVRFTADLKTVLISARIDKAVAQTMPPEAQFWVISPQVSASGITGLSTVLSGVYIEGAWDAVQGSDAREFSGLAAVPVVQPGRAGTRVTLRSTDGSTLPSGGPIFFRGVEVGVLDTPRVSAGGDSAIIDAFVEAPYDRYITTATRFWDTSGFSVKLGTSGLDLSVSSIGALLRGGVAFDTTFSGGQPIGDSTVFNLFYDEASARQSIFTQIGDAAVPMAVIFGGSINGLEAGAPVEFRGLRVGQVTAISAFIERTPGGKRTVRLRTSLDIDPRSLGLEGPSGKPEVLAFLRGAVEQGLRARLATTSLFSAALKVELVEIPGTPSADISADADGIPILPSVASNLPDFTATAEGVLERINALPIEDVMQQAISLMASIEAVAASEGTQTAPGALVALLDDARAFLNQGDTQALPGELRGTIAELRRVVADLQERGAVDTLVSTLRNVDKLSADLALATEGFPALVTDFRELAAKANGLRAEELIDSTTKLLQSADAVIGTDAARALPASLSSALGEVQAALKELRDGGAVTNANAALASARTAADAVASAADDLPTLTRQLDGLIANANALVAAYGNRSTFNAETLNLLREIRKAASAVTQLARTIERNPNSLLLGR
jgi:paraquat-inducible protein B